MLTQGASQGQHPRVAEPGGGQACARPRRQVLHIVVACYLQREGLALELGGHDSASQGPNPATVARNDFL